MLRPLTKRRTDGTPYQRRAHVEARLRELVKLSRAEIRELLTVRDRSDPRFIPTECLIYLLRDAKQGNTPAWFNALFRVIEGRCKQTLTRTIRALGTNDHETLREEALSRVMMRLARGLEQDPEKLDAFEVAFDMVLAAIRKDLFESEFRRTKPLIELRFPDPDGDEADPVMEFVAPVSGLAADLGMQESEFEAFRKDAMRSIDVLPAELRDPILLLFGGLPIDSKDPSADTIAKRQGVDERTVRNRLKRAISRLNGTQGTDQ